MNTMNTIDEQKNDELEQYIPIQKNRRRVYEKFLNLLQNHVGNGEYRDFNFSPSALIKFALNLERGIFNYALRRSVVKDLKTWDWSFELFYINRASIVYRNLNPTNRLGNELLLKRLLLREIDEFELCSLQPKDMFPRRAEELDQMYKEQLPVDTNAEKPDGILKCGKCKSYKTEYVEKQTRSADEPTTKFCYCYNCGNRWRFC